MHGALGMEPASLLRGCLHQTTAAVSASRVTGCVIHNADRASQHTITMCISTHFTPPYPRLHQGASDCCARARTPCVTPGLQLVVTLSCSQWKGHTGLQTQGSCCLHDAAAVVCLGWSSVMIGCWLTNCCCCWSDRRKLLVLGVDLPPSYCVHAVSARKTQCIIYFYLFIYEARSNQPLLWLFINPESCDTMACTPSC